MSEYQKPPDPPAIPAADAPQHSSLLPGWDFAHRHRTWTVPFLLVPPLFAAAGFTLAVFRQHTTVIVAAVVASLAVWFFAPHKWTGKDGQPRWKEVWYARLSVLAAGGWLSAASFTGISLIMACVLAGLALAWGVPWFVHKRPRSRFGDKASVHAWNLWWQHHARGWGLSGSAVVAVESKGTMETLTIQLWAGRQTYRQVADLIEQIESALSGYVRSGSARADRNTSNPSQVLLRLKREDPLAVPSHWHPGMAITSVTQPAPIGFTETADVIRVVLLANWFIIGKSRWGKSTMLSEMLASITGCDDALVWLVDMKGGRAARPWMPAIDWCATTVEEADIMFTVARDELKARATHSDDSKEQLDPTGNVPALFIVIDEAYEVTSVAAGSARLAALLAVIASMGMGVAVYVIVVTQYGALDESVRSEQIRSNLIYRICFSVTQAAHGQFALTDWQRLDASKLREKGSFYYQLGPDTPSAPARGHKMEHDLVRVIAARHGAMPRPKLTLYATEHQQIYDDRWQRLPQPFWRSAPQTDALDLAAAPPPTPAAAIGVPVSNVERTSAAMAAQIEDEVAGLPDTDPARMPSDAEVRQVLGSGKHRFARALVNAPPEGIQPKQLVAASGMSRGWVMGLLKTFGDAGFVIKPDPQQPLYRCAGALTAEQIMTLIDQVKRRDDALLQPA